MMSQYPDLLTQIDLQEADVQYVDPREPEAAEYSVNTPDLYADTEYKSNSAPHDYTDVRNDIVENFDKPASSVLMFNDPQEQNVPDIMQPNGESFGLKSEPGRIVIRKPLDDSAEGGTFVSEKTRVVPPPRQFAYTAATNTGEGSTEIHHHGNSTQFSGSAYANEAEETAIDTPSSDDFPPPPTMSVIPDEHHEENIPYVAIGADAGYSADRSNSISPTHILVDHEETEDFTESHYHEDKLVTPSEPVSIEGVTDRRHSLMTTSPVSSVKTSESDITMLTSSVESDNILLDSANSSGMVIDVKEQELSPRETKLSPDDTENGFLFQMDDIKSKLSNSLEVIAIQENDKTQDDRYHLEEEKEFVIEDTSCQLDYFFTYENKNQTEDSKSVSSENIDEYKTPHVGPSMSDITVDTSLGQTDIRSAPLSAPSILESDVSYEENQDDNVKKSAPVKRKKSVKELLSRFEVMTNSPPKEEKVRPPVFQKPKLVRLHSLKSDDFENDPTLESGKNVVGSIRRDDINLMSASCPEATKILSLSPKSVDIESEKETEPKTKVSPQTSINTNTESNIERNRPSVRNKIKQFEWSDPVISDSPERSKSRSPSRLSNGEHSPVAKGRQRALSPVPPVKSVIIKEQHKATDIPLDNDTAAQGQKLSQYSPSMAKVDSQRSASQTSFHMRSASSGTSSTFLEGSKNTKESVAATPESLLERKRKFESSTDSISSDSGTASLETFRRGSLSKKLIETQNVSVEQPKDTQQHEKYYDRSVSVPNNSSTLEYSSASDKVTAPSSNESGILKPSQLFSRRSKRQSEPPPVPKKNTLMHQENISVSQDGDDLMSASFSDRRKLFEASSQSTSTSVYSSLKRNDPPKGNDEMSKSVSYSTNNGNVGGSSGGSLKRESLPQTNKKNLSNSATEGSDSLYSDYTARARNYGQKSVVIQSKDTPSVTTAEGGAANTTKTPPKTYPKEQKENVKPAIVFKTLEKDIGIGQNERSGTVKDLWKKFEQQNT